MAATTMATNTRLARGHTLGDLPRRSAARYGDKTALIDGDQQLSFRELANAVDRVASAIAAAGIGPGDRIALLSHNCWQFVVLSFAAARRGVVLVPINFMLGAEEIAYILRDCAPVAFVCEDSLTGVADKALDQAELALDHRLAIDLDAGIAEEWTDLRAWLDYSGPAADPVTVADDDPVRLMYTSGTESRPKGALLSSRSLLWQYVSCAVDGEMSPEDVELHALPLYHCAQMDCFLSVDVYLGATSVILRGPDPAVLLAMIQRHRANKLFAPPTVWISLLNDPEFDRTDLSTLTKAYYGAAAMPVEVLHELGSRLPRTRLWNFYGQTEMAPMATILRPEDQLRKPGSAGKPALNVETIIVDDDGNPCPQGEVGEIVHRSPHATLGYLGDETKTAETFAGGWFHSGDLGRFDEDGYLYVVDRKKDMIKTGGENVASREVEEAIYRMDGVAEVAVFGVDHPKWIEAVAAVVVPKPEASVDADAVTEFARTVLAPYKVPKYVVLAEALPKNPSGKILKRQLRHAYADLAQT